MPSYEDWIREHCADWKSRCVERTAEMAAAFPELRRVRGWVTIAWGGRVLDREHWWLVTPAGQVVDPTARQFSDPGYIFAGGRILGYQELPDDAEEPVGKCMSCGSYYYRSQGGDSYSCSPSCACFTRFYMQKVAYSGM